MGWVRKTDPPPVHECSPPTRPVTWPQSLSGPYMKSVADGGEVGSLWRCDECGKLWQVYLRIVDHIKYHYWESATFWNRWKYPAPKHPWPEPPKPTAVQQDQELPPRPGVSTSEQWGDIPD